MGVHYRQICYREIMKKLIVFIFLNFLMTSNANAEWKKIASNTNGDVMYIDKKTLKIVNNTRYILIMLDYVNPSKFGDLSSRSYRAINCNNMMWKDLVKDYFTLPLAKGNTSDGSGTIKNPEWKYSTPDSLGGGLHIKVCEMK